jgi:hypothetical protein
MDAALAALAGSWIGMAVGDVVGSRLIDLAAPDGGGDDHFMLRVVLWATAFAVGSAAGCFAALRWRRYPFARQVALTDFWISSIGVVLAAAFDFLFLLLLVPAGALMLAAPAIACVLEDRGQQRRATPSDSINPPV